MLKIRLSLTIILITMFLAACASAEDTAPAATAALLPTVSAPTAAVNSPTLQPPTEIAAATEALAPTTLPIATSRGPDLEATDPGSVSLASGGLQFVEFFRFT